MKENNLGELLIFGDKFRLLRHFLFWLFVFSDEILSFFGVTEPLMLYWYEVMLGLGCYMLVVYINIYYFIPKFFQNGKILLYALLTALSILVIMSVDIFLYGGSFEELFTPSYFLTALVIDTSIVLMAVALKLTGSLNKQNKEIQTLNQTNLKTELAYLKTQVNPHFLFNTLNNIYVMSQKQDEKLPDTIMHLSDMLRYQLYECDDEYVPLTKEIDYLQNYINIEKLRRSDLKVDFDIKGQVSTKSIRPLILLPFVENAFKYSKTGSDTSSHISITIDINDEGFHFSCINSLGSLTSSEVGGIGQTNAKRRLELAYPNNHELSYNEGNGQYIVDLKIYKL